MLAAVYFRAPSDQKITIYLFLLLEALKFGEELLLIPLRQYGLDAAERNGLAALVVEAVELVETGHLDRALELLYCALAAEAMLACKLHGGQISHGLPLARDLVGVANGAVLFIFLRIICLLLGLFDLLDDLRSRGRQFPLEVVD